MHARLVMFKISHRTPMCTDSLTNTYTLLVAGHYITSRPYDNPHCSDDHTCQQSKTFGFELQTTLLYTWVSNIWVF